MNIIFRPIQGVDMARRHQWNRSLSSQIPERDSQEMLLFREAMAADPVSEGTSGA